MKKFVTLDFIPCVFKTTFENLPSFISSNNEKHQTSFDIHGEHKASVHIPVVEAGAKAAAEAAEKELAAAKALAAKAQAHAQAAPLPKPVSQSQSQSQP